MMRAFCLSVIAVSVIAAMGQEVHHLEPGGEAVQLLEVAEAMDSQHASVRELGESSTKKKDCADTLSCKKQKGKKSDAQKAKAGLFGKRKVNVKQMDSEQKVVDKQKAKAKEGYHKLLKGTYKDGKGKKKKGKNAAKEVLAKSDKRKSAREGARKKMAAAKTKAKEKAKKSLLNSKEKIKKKTAKESMLAQERARKKAKQPKTAEGWVQRAAEARFHAYKLRMAAAKIAQKFAKRKAKRIDVTKADKAAKAATAAAKHMQEKAIKAHKNKKVKRKKKKAAAKAKRKAKRKVKKMKKAKKKKKKVAKKVKRRKKVTKKKKPRLCSRKACNRRCKTALCKRYCMRCLKVRTEKLVYNPISGLQPASTVTKRTLSPEMHAMWVDQSMQHLRNMDKRDHDASTFAVDQFTQVHCKHCQQMCEDQHIYNAPQKAACKSQCTSCQKMKKNEKKKKQKKKSSTSHQNGGGKNKRSRKGSSGPNSWQCKHCHAKCKSSACHTSCGHRFCGVPKPKRKPKPKQKAKPAPKPASVAKTSSTGNPLSTAALQKAEQTGQHVHIIKLPTVVVERQKPPSLPKATHGPAMIKRKIRKKASAMAHGNKVAQ